MAENLDINYLASNPIIRVINQDDFEALEQVDKVYSEHFGLASALSLGSLNFYARTGHAFASLMHGKVTGVVLAQAIWDGLRPVLHMNRLAVLDASDELSRHALFDALTKSAYDAAVYDLQLSIPKADTLLTSIAKTKDYVEVATLIFERTLGSRGLKT